MYNRTAGTTDNPHPDLLGDLKDDNLLRMLPMLMLDWIILLVGLVGNVLVFKIYFSHRTKSNFRCFVLSMAVVDLINCVIRLPGEMYYLTHAYSYKLDWLCRVTIFCNVFTNVTFSLILLLLAFDRFRKLTSPLKRQIRPSQAQKLCFAFFVTGCMLAIGSPINWGRVDYTHTVEGLPVNVSVCQTLSSFTTTLYSLYIGPMCLMLMFIATFSLLAALKSINIWKLKRTQNVWSRKLPEVGRDQQSMCFTISNKNGDICAENMGGTFVTTPPKPQKTAKQARLSVAKPITDFFEAVERENGNDIQSAVDDGQKKDYIQRSSKVLDEAVKMKTDNDITNCDKAARSRRKTIIMLVLTWTYVLTQGIAVTLTVLTVQHNDVLRALSPSQYTAFYFFWNLNNVNIALNPILYRATDPRFQTGIKRLLNKIKSYRYRD